MCYDTHVTLLSTRPGSTSLIGGGVTTGQVGSGVFFCPTWWGLGHDQGRKNVGWTAVAAERRMAETGLSGRLTGATPGASSDNKARPGNLPPLSYSLFLRG